jgi:hypothetical protein
MADPRHEYDGSSWFVSRRTETMAKTTITRTVGPTQRLAAKTSGSGTAAG